VLILEELVSPRICHQVLAEIVGEEGDVGWAAVAVAGRERDGVPPLVAKQLLKTSAKSKAANSRQSRDVCDYPILWLK
jgi:hypothetical protein